ncbi:3-dehydroquinate synthase [hydrothermal vent metagenome]|uniref:3-dehydroquinate synthase n=1 Tax=hydrothermal vent metagenome TaxID=652676 RepID=A0A3B1BUY5_9ZZZZ
MKKIKIPIEQNTYDVYLGCDIFDQLFKIAEKLKLNKNIMMIPDEKFYNIRKAEIDHLIKTYHGKLNIHVIQATEKLKSFYTLQKIFTELLNKEYTRDTLLVALGGGIIGDIVGFAASIFSRGVQYVQVPTTLLAAVDSSVGGKTGINFGNTKNIIGAFKQPKFVLIDSDFLDTLPKKEIISGLGEVIKYAYLTNQNFYNYILSNVDNILEKKKDVLEKIIEESVRFKGDVVANDEKESGTRKMLNLGHTFAHAFEVEQNYKIKHGHAVIIGIACALFLSNKLNLLNDKKLNSLLELLIQVKGLIKISDVDYKKSISIMKRDKKNRDGKIKFVLLKDIGGILIDVEASDRDIKYALKMGLSIFR